VPVTPVAVQKDALIALFESAFKNARDSGSAAGADSDLIIHRLSSDLASAVESFVVGSQVTINPGIPVVVMPATGTGSTVGPGMS